MSDTCCRDRCSRRAHYVYEDLWFCHQHCPEKQSFSEVGRALMMATVRREILEDEAGVLPRQVSQLSDDDLRTIRTAGGLVQLIGWYRRGGR